MSATQNEVDSALIDAFVRKHFSFRGSIDLHRNALGWDLLRAPANLLLAPVFITVRLASLIFYALGARKVAQRLLGARILFKSAVSRAITDAVFNDLIKARSKTEIEHARIKRMIDDYADVRNAVSEIVTAVIFLSVGYVVFRTATPGVISLAPVLSDFAARGVAVANFPLGSWAGNAWYTVFPVKLPVWYVILVGLTLACGASLATTFAGLIADPIQGTLGIHRRRLLRLLRTLDAGQAGRGLAREHVLARFGDLSDLGLSLVRLFRP